MKKENKQAFDETMSFLSHFGGRYFIQTFDDNKARGHPKLIHSFMDADVQDCYDELVALNKAGAGIYFCVNELVERSTRLAKNVINIRAHFADLDGAPIGPVLNHSPLPDLVLRTSQDKWHAYWIMRESTLPEANRFREIQRAIAQKFSADKSITDLPRVMRLPGFYNMKSAEKPFYIECFDLSRPEIKQDLHKKIFGPDYEDVACL